MSFSLKNTPRKSAKDKTLPELSRMVKETCFDILEIPAPVIEAESKREPEPVRKLRLAFWR